MVIRKATLSDAKIIATCLLLAMEDIVYRFICVKDSKKAKVFLLHFVVKENNQYSFQNCWVAENNKEVVGVANVYDGSRLKELRNPILQYIRDEINNQLIPEDETEAGEYYLDSLGVISSQQGKGIGTAILKFVIEEYVHRCGQTLGLLVEESNTGAKKLYLSLGFKVVNTKTFMSKKMVHLQLSPQGSTTCGK